MSSRTDDKSVKPAPRADGDSERADRVGKTKFPAKPVETPLDYDAMRARAKKRFSKTLAYLAK